MAPPATPAVHDLGPGEVSDLVELLTLVQSSPDLWHQRLYAQERLANGGPGASLGEPIPVADSEPHEVERAMVQRLGGACDVLVRAHSRGSTRTVTKYVRVIVGEAAARSYLAAAPAAATARGASEADTLRAELAATRARLEALTSGPTAGQASAWDLAVKLQEMQDKAFDRAVSMLQRAAPAPSSTSTGAPPELYQRLGRLEALQEVGNAGSAPAGVPWAELAPLAAPIVERVVGALDKMAEARTAEAEARMAEALARGDGRNLHLVRPPAAPAPAPAPAVVESVSG